MAYIGQGILVLLKQAKVATLDPDFSPYFCLVIVLPEHENTKTPNYKQSNCFQR